MVDIAAVPTVGMSQTKLCHGKLKLIEYSNIGAPYGLIFDWRMAHRLLTSRLILFTFQNLDRNPDVYFQFFHFANQVRIMDLTKGIKWYYAGKQLHAIGVSSESWSCY